MKLPFAFGYASIYTVGCFIAGSFELVNLDKSFPAIQIMASTWTEDRDVSSSTQNHALKLLAKLAASMKAQNAWREPSRS